MWVIQLFTFNMYHLSSTIDDDVFLLQISLCINGLREDGSYY
jgi:hypothetical protein